MKSKTTVLGVIFPFCNEVHEDVDDNDKSVARDRSKILEEYALMESSYIRKVKLKGMISIYYVHVLVLSLCIGQGSF
jgi:hypothetical protein